MEVDVRGAAPTLLHPTPGPREAVLPTEMLQVQQLPKQARQARRRPMLFQPLPRRPRRARQEQPRSMLAGPPTRRQKTRKRHGVLDIRAL